MSKAKIPSKQNLENYHTPNSNAVIRDVLIAALAKGQFLVALVALVLIILICRIPSEDITKLLLDVLNLFSEMYMLGWLITFIMVPTSVILFIRSRKLHRREIENIGRLENAEPQKQITAGK